METKRITVPEIESDKIDELEVSRFPLKKSISISLTKIQEFKIVQKFLKEIKFVLSFDEEVLREQSTYWLYSHNISCVDQRDRIKLALESHCCCPMGWLSQNELEIDVNPDHKIIKISAKHI